MLVSKENGHCLRVYPTCSRVLSDDEGHFEERVRGAYGSQWERGDVGRLTVTRHWMK